RPHDRGAGALEPALQQPGVGARVDARRVGQDRVSRATLRVGTGPPDRDCADRRAGAADVAQFVIWTRALERRTLARTRSRRPGVWKRDVARKEKSTAYARTTGTGGLSHLHETRSLLQHSGLVRSAQKSVASRSPHPPRQGGRTPSNSSA